MDGGADDALPDGLVDEPDDGEPPLEEAHWQGWCGFGVEPLGVENACRVRNRQTAGQTPEFPYEDHTIVITPSPDRGFVIERVPDGGAFQDEPGTGTLQSANDLRGLAQAQRAEDIIGWLVGSFELVGQGYTAFGVPVERVSILGAGALAFGGIEETFSMSTDVTRRRRQLDAVDVPYLAYFLDATRVSQQSLSGGQPFWIDEFEDRLVLTMDRVSYFYHPNCDRDDAEGQCSVDVQLRWFKTGRIEIHYQNTGGRQGAHFELGLGGEIIDACEGLDAPSCDALIF